MTVAGTTGLGSVIVQQPNGSNLSAGGVGASAVGDTTHSEQQNTTVTGHPPRRRIATAEAAYTIYKKLKDHDEEGDAMRRAIIKGMIDGNPPYDQAELEERGLGAQCNVNFLSLRANLDARAGAAHELFAEVPTLIELRPKVIKPQDPDSLLWCQIMAEEWSDMVREWDGFYSNMDLVVRESDAYGLGYVLFPDEWDWRPQAFRRGNLLFDPKARIDIDRNDLYFVRDELDLGTLYEKIEDEKVAAELGWKVANVRKLLIRKFIGGEQGDQTEQYQVSRWESLLQMARNNELTFQEKQFEKLRVVHGLSREVSTQKVTHFIIAEDGVDRVFLYERESAYDQVGDVLWWLPYNYGDGYARSVRGVASYMVQHDDLSNRFLCRVFDAGFMTSSLLLQPRTSADLSRLALVQHGPYTIIPPELEAVQSTFQPQIAPLIQLRGVSEQVMKNNTGTYRQHAETISEEGLQKTARQVVEETAKEARYEKAAVVHRYVQLDKLYRVMFARSTRREYHDRETALGGQAEARDFIKRCEARGVPKSFILDGAGELVLRATRSIGLGSLGARLDITGRILNASGMFDEAGKREAAREYVAALTSYRHADRFVPRVNRDQIASNEVSIAVLENNDMAEGQAPMVGYDQQHVLHLNTHLQHVIIPVIQAVQTGQVTDPQKAAVALERAVPHAQMHLQAIAGDPRRKQYVQQVQGILQDAQAAYTKLQAAVKRIVAAQQRAQQEQGQRLAQADQVLRDRELEVKLAEIQSKRDMEALKQQSLNNMRAEKTAEQMRIRREQAAEDLRLKAERQAAELAMEARRTDADIALKQAR